MRCRLDRESRQTCTHKDQMKHDPVFNKSIYGIASSSHCGIHDISIYIYIYIDIYIDMNDDSVETSMHILLVHQLRLYLEISDSEWKWRRGCLNKSLCFRNILAWERLATNLQNRTPAVDKAIFLRGANTWREFLDICISIL